MSAVFAASPASANHTESIDGWPLLYKEFELNRDFEFTPRDQPEVFLVLAGTFLHEHAEDVQSMRAGSIIISQPGQHHFARQPGTARLVRLRYLPEWMVNDIHMILDSPDLLSLFFARILFDYPSDPLVNVISLKREPLHYVISDLSVLKDLVQLPPCVRAHWRRISIHSPWRTPGTTSRFRLVRAIRASTA